MRGFLLDTCAVSEFAKPAPDLGLVEWLSRVDSSLLLLSAVTIGELRFGIDPLAEERKRAFLEAWLTSVLSDFGDRVLAFDGEVAQRWGRLRAHARAKTAPVPVLDSMIAATALHHGLAVVTRNREDFGRLGTDIVDPWTA